MGREKQYLPARLPEKLIHIRNHLDGGLSQDDMVRRLGMPEELNRNYISCLKEGRGFRHLMYSSLTRE